MTLALAQGDGARLGAALATLLSPLDHETLTSWGGPVAGSCAALLAADQAFLAIPAR